jgi:hypothetical protein
MGVKFYLVGGTSLLDFVVSKRKLKYGYGAHKYWTSAYDYESRKENKRENKEEENKKN